MYLAPSDQALLPLAVIDITALHSHRPTAPSLGSAHRPVAARRRVAAVGANIVRLIPGRTRLPFGAGAR
jgi:hypothetical protein